MASPDVPAVIPASKAVARLPLGRLATVIAAHGIVDWLSAVIVPILSYLEGRVNMTPGQGALLLAVGSVSSGVIQPLVAVLSDKHNTRWAGTAGLIAAALAIGCVGFAENYTQLLIIQIIGTAGIGAFHPVGAAATGQLAGRARAGAISIFYAAGLAGGVLGSFGVPVIAKEYGLKTIAWVIPPVLLFAFLLGWSIHRVGHQAAGARETHGALAPAERSRRWRDIGLLYFANIFRFVVNMMLVQLVIRWCEVQVLRHSAALELTKELRLDASGINGWLQGMMALGMGVSGLALGWFVPPAMMKRWLIGMPLVGAPAIVLFPRLQEMGFDGVVAQGTGVDASVMMCFMAALIGMAYSAVMPLTITLAQRLLPHRTSLASALMMGGAWTFACVGPPLAQKLIQAGVPLERCFDIVAVLLGVSGILAIPLGKPPGEERGGG